MQGHRISMRPFGVLGLVLAACGSPAPQGDDATTTAAPTTAAVTTAAATTTSTLPPTTVVASTTPALDHGFVPACVERRGSGPAPSDPPGLDALAPFGEEPVVQLPLPEVIGGMLDDTARPRLSRVPGGMLVDLRPYNGSEVPFGMLMVVDADGGVRWQRCPESMPNVVTGAHGVEALAIWSTYGAQGLETTEVELWSLATGEVSRSWANAIADAGLPPIWADSLAVWTDLDAGVVVFALRGDRATTPSDSLLVVEADDMSMRLIPYPAASVGRPLDEVWLGVGPDGTLFDGDTWWGPVHAVATADGWSTDDRDLAAALGVRVQFDGEPQVLTAVDHRGEVVWRRRDLFAFPGEGFRTRVDGPVTLVDACAGPPTADVVCPGPVLLAVDTATGRTRWTKEGSWSVSVVGGGRALLAGPYSGTGEPPFPPWVLVDLRTGRQVGTTEWADPWHFGIGCCDEPARAWISGGVVFTADSNSVELWYPAAVSTPMVTVSLGAAG